ncbi:PTX4 isoform 1 [Pongo abelii]|uniref:PTX4 isoform 1 n=1 Tax=Pongo abelii TaxID=9601 RepID=A0A2J8R935_PONAB|nr:PTX4 isoform 1 [Pongo abelii]
MGCLWRKILSFFLVFVPIYLHGASSQEAAPVGPRKPFFERLRRLEEQFWRFQEVTRTHLQSIASNYNVSYNVDVRFQSLAEESQAVAQTVNRSQASVQGELAQLKAWVRKMQRRSWKFAAWAPLSFSQTPPPRTWSSSALASSLPCEPCPSAAGSARPPAAWAPSCPTPPRTMTTSWCCTAETPCCPDPSTL